MSTVSEESRTAVAAGTAVSLDGSSSDTDVLTARDANIAAGEKLDAAVTEMVASSSASSSTAVAAGVHFDKLVRTAADAVEDGKQDGAASKMRRTDAQDADAEMTGATPAVAAKHKYKHLLVVDMMAVVVVRWRIVFAWP